jgi:flagellar hook assembly protein FlgD
MKPFLGPRPPHHVTPPPAGRVDLRIFDASGRLVRTLERGILQAGSHTVEWDGADADGRDTASGRYCLRLRADKAEKTLPIVLVR